MREAQILNEIPNRLESLVRQPARVLRNIDPEIDAVVEAGPYRFLVEIKGAPRVPAIRQACQHLKEHARSMGSSVVPMVVVPFMGPSGQGICLSHEVSFMDLSGNAHIEAEGLLVHVEGKPNRFLSRGRPSSVFAPKSSRVARVLLLEPRRWWRQSELAEQAELGRGYVSRIIGRLKQDGLVSESDDGMIRSSDPGLLLDAWSAEYEFEKHRIIAGHVPSRSGEDTVRRFVNIMQAEQCEYALTGLAAAALWAPFASFRLVAAFVQREPDEQLIDRLAFREEKKGANLWLAVPNDEGVFAGAKDIKGQRCVSAVQAYLDLQHMPERSKEAAQHLRSVCLQHAE